MTSRVLKHVLIAIVGLSLVAVSAPVFSADVTGKTSTQTLPTQTNTQTAPLPSNTQTAPLPSTTREYQQVDKPPVKTLDIPDWDLAGQLRNLEFDRCGVGKNQLRIKFRLALMNKGKLQGSKDIPLKITVLNVTNNTVIKQDKHFLRRQTIRNDMWELTEESMGTIFRLGPTTASSINDVKLIVDIDPRNTFGEAQRHRGNNRCIATW